MTLKFKLGLDFYRATLYQRGISRHHVSVCLSVRLSICPSHAGIVS